MKRTLYKLTLTVSFLCCIRGFSQNQNINENTWQNGDIVFINNSQMSKSQSSNPEDKFNCAGIIMKENGHPVVYYASEPFKKVTFHEFISYSTDQKYSIKWLHENELLTDEVINTMRTFSNAKLGSPYDNNENMNSEELYNAEYIWKIYMNCLGVKLTEPKVKELTASGDNNKLFAPEKDKTSKLANKFVSVMDLYRSDLLD